MGKWEKLSEEHILKSLWLSVRKDAYKTPEEGKIEDFYIVERPDFVVIVPQTEEKKFILVRQYRHGIEDTILNFPMGFINKGEEPEAAAQRELLEETGFSGNIFSLGSFLLAPSFTKTTGYVFGVNNIKKENNTKDFEIDKIITVSESRLEDLINTNQLRGVSSICAYLLMKRKSHVR